MSAMKRFYKNASVMQVGDHYGIALDEKPIKTPAGKPLCVPNAELAQAIADEWAAQVETINANSMPMMQLSATTLDHVPHQRAQMIERLLAYVGTDLVCHFVDEPKRLHDMQHEYFTPVLSWLRRRYDVEMHTTTELMAVVQPALTTQRLSKALSVLDDWALMGVQTAALASGSLVLALGMQEKEFTAAEVFDAAEVESTYQIEKWGVDEELTRRREGVRRELAAVEKWFELLDVII